MSDKRERVSVKITEFYGVVDSAGAEDLPNGAAQKQVNVASRKLGLLQTRRGYLPVTFDDSIVFPTLGNNGYVFNGQASLTAGAATLSGSGTFTP